jgi:hypothetical protein
MTAVPQEAVVPRSKRRAFSSVLTLLAVSAVGLAAWSVLGVAAPPDKVHTTVRYIPLGTGPHAVISTAQVVFVTVTRPSSMLKLGEVISQDAQLAITVAVMVVMVVGLTPKSWKFWRRWL